MMGTGRSRQREVIGQLYVLELAITHRSGSILGDTHGSLTESILVTDNILAITLLPAIGLG